MAETIKLLRIYTDEAAYLGDRKVLEVIASRAREEGMAGITVLDARLGFGRSAHIHRRHVFVSEIGRASSRERVCQYVESLVVAVSLNRNNHIHPKAECADTKKP